jgi:hypothetical protein
MLIDDVIFDLILFYLHSFQILFQMMNDEMVYFSFKQQLLLLVIQKINFDEIEIYFQLIEYQRI